MANRILVVDDEPDLLELVRLSLAEAGFSVETAETGREAIDKLQRAAPDLVVLDLMLPDMSGTEVCRWLRGRPEGADLLVLMLTAKGEEVDRVVGFELGADDYVTKPFSLRELSARVRAQFRRVDRAAESEAPPAAVEVGPVVVDLAGHRLLRDGVTLPVKPKAFELLAFLLRHPGQVFTRDQLLERVWGYDYAGETRTVDVHIHWLRSQIEEDPRDPAFIHTVRGVGYVFRRPT